jgi:hypothetical protein
MLIFCGLKEQERRKGREGKGCQQLFRCVSAGGGGSEEGTERREEGTHTI